MKHPWDIIYEEKVRTRSGYHAYHMRRWLRLLRRSRSLSSYPFPLSLLIPWGIDRNINMSNLYEEGVNNCSMNTYNPQRLEASTISYEVNQPTKPNSWDSTVLPIFFFGTNKFIEIDANNISILLLHIVNFIQNRSLLNKTEKEIGFGQAT